ncbi:MAG: hypothetical protein ACXVPY_11930 [Bacteroidia bacterium]
MSNKKYSIPSIAFIFAFILSIFFYFDLWNRNRITIDAPSYYTYLPATIIHHDLHLNYIDANPEFYKDKVWYYKIEDGKKLIKHPMGISVMLSPFFIVGHWIASWVGAPRDGYSMPYQNSVSIGVLIYLFIGLYFLRKILLGYFSEKITALTLISVTLGTNLLWYSSFEGLMPHAISFSLWCICIYSFFNWLKTGASKFIFSFSVAFGLIVLIRPLSIVSILYFLIYAVISFGGIKNFIGFLKPEWKNIFAGAVISFLIASLQLCYWKYATGHWLYDVYVDEHFIFSSPQMLPFLFSFRKGVFIYTPILIFAIIGLIKIYKTNSALFYSTIIFMTITVFLLSSWWAWSYGICWGMRPMIDYYALLSLPMAAGFTYFTNKKKIVKIIFFTITTLLIALNLFQTWQYKNGLIHYDDMSKEAYFKGFFQTKISEGWVDLLKPYDWDRRMKGLPQINYSKEYFDKLDLNQNISLRGNNLLYFVVNPKAQNAMGAIAKGVLPESMFSIEHLKGDTVCIRSKNGLLWSLKSNYENAITATEMLAHATEKFTIDYLKDDDNKIAIKASNGKYVSIGSQWPFIVKATAGAVSDEESFRYFVIGN